MAVDPVCHMEVDSEEAADKSEYKGRTYYFCSSACAEKFEENPQRYAGKPPQSSVA